MGENSITKLSRIAAVILLLLCSLLIIISIFFSSPFLAILGTALGFWGGIFFYITPTKQLPLSIINAIEKAHYSNINRILSKIESDKKCIYLPPKYLRNVESSLIMVINRLDLDLLKKEQIPNDLILNYNKGILLTPPGYFLVEIFEKKIGTNFIKTDLNFVQKSLPKILTDLSLVENVEITVKHNFISVKLYNNILFSIYKNSANKTKEPTGCILSSAIACIIAKATGIPITIINETYEYRNKINCIDFELIGEQN